MDVVLVPVIGEFLEHDAILLHAFDEFIGPGANRMQSELVAFASFAALGETIIPARSVSWAINGE